MNKQVVSVNTTTSKYQESSETLTNKENNTPDSMSNPSFSVKRPHDIKQVKRAEIKLTVKPRIVAHNQKFVLSNLKSI